MSGQGADWPLFTARYGIGTAEDSPHGHMAYRHTESHRPDGCEPASGLRCRCSGSFTDSRTQCCQRATSEDMRCDDCRAYCVGLDDLGEYHPIPLVAAFCESTP